MLDRTIRAQGLVDPDRSFLTELVYGTIRWRGNLDWVLRQFVLPRKLKNLERMRGSGSVSVLDILRLGLYQLLFLDGVPDHAAVNESVELAKKCGYEGLSGLVNAVLRRAARSRGTISYPDIRVDPIKYIAARYSHPEWLVKRWIERYGVDETIQLCSANNLRAPLYIRTNLLNTSRDQLISSLEKEGARAVPSCNLPESIKITEIPSSVNELSSYRRGWFQVQDESSMLASHILDPQPGETVIDICAAPGGKSTHIAELMQNRGKIWAFDIDARRLPLVSQACQRLGITIVQAIEADARKLDERLSGEKADRVLVDAPCTGLGVLRRRVEIRWRRTPDQLEKFPGLQYAILASAARHVKPGGVLVYCTCSIEPEENQQVVARFLEAHPQFQIEIPPIPPLKTGQPSYSPFGKGGGGDLSAGARDPVSAEGYMQTYPHLHDMDGFFAARMINSE
jgi:16S rRNA (cytosine967-C5)-methyltransferase